MPLPSNNTTEVQFRCTIKYMFNNCPKPDGWFGCYAQMRGGMEIKLTGKTMIPLTRGMQLDVTAKKKSETDYDAIDITVVTKTLTGIKAYLMSLKGVSEPTARLLISTFGCDAIDMIKTDPVTVQTKTKLTDRQMSALIKSVNSSDEINQLRTFLPELSSDAINYLRKNYSTPKTIIQQNPWCLLNCPHTSFSTVDAIALRLGVNPASDDRIEQGILHIIYSMQGNDNYINLSDHSVVNGMMIKTQDLLHIRFGHGLYEFEQRILLLSQKSGSPIVIRQYNNEYHLYLTQDYNDYMFLVSYINANKLQRNNLSNSQTQQLQAFIKAYSANLPYHLSKEQTDAVNTVLSSRLSVLTGGPGRGKTITVGCIAASKKALYPTAKILLLAPTGKAVKKLIDDTDNKYETMTIDRLICTVTGKKTDEKEIKISSKTRKKRGPDKAYYQAHYNTPHTLIIIDESSMIDIPKIAELIRLFPEPQYCFVGDKDQLPPVGKGQFFKDIINCGHIPVARLTKAMRNNGVILENAEKINQKDTTLKYTITEMPFFPQNADDDETLQNIIDIYNNERDLEPDDNQIVLMSPIRKSGVGTVNINIALQNLMCPENLSCTASFNKKHKKTMFVSKGHTIPNTFFGVNGNYTRFRIGDKVMCTKNNYSIPLKKYENNDYFNGDVIETSDGIFNGDSGKIIAYISADAVGNDTDSDFIIVQFNDGWVAEINRAEGDFDSFILGYASTVHKMQGCEFNTVIYVSPHALATMTHSGFACKNLVYTAVTRARNKAIIIGSKDSLNACIQTDIAVRNSTFLNEIL